MPMDQSSTTPERHPDLPNPPHESVEQRITRVREGLEVIFGDLEMVLDVCITVHKAMLQQHANQDGDFARVLKRYGSDELHRQLEELNDVIEDLGGSTSFRKTEDEQTLTPLAAVVLKVTAVEGGEDE